MLISSEWIGKGVWMRGRVRWGGNLGWVGSIMFSFLVVVEMIV